MKIGIDARFYGPLGKGLGRYTQKLIENLEKISGAEANPKNQYFILLRKENFAEYQPGSRNFHKILADFPWYTFSEQIRMPRLLKKLELDLVHFPHFNVPLFYFGKFIVTIHDLILLHFPTVKSTTLPAVFYWLKFFAYKIVISSAVRRAKSIIAVSRFTKADILKNYRRISAEKITVTYEACDDYCFFNPRPAEEILPRYGIIKPYLLYVGNVYPHKNPERLVLALKQLEKQIPELRLVFVGGEDYFYARLKKFVNLEKINNIIFAGFVPDHDLDVVFKEAVAYVRPSLYEGFELPPLEAMARGVPAICSDHNCAREILENSPAYFNGKNIEDISRVIKNVFMDASLRESLINKGYIQSKKYSWQKMAQETLMIYQNATK